MSRVCSWVWAACALVAGFPTGALAQADRVNSLQDGAWALQFGIGSNFTLNAFNGATISVKKHLSDRSAVRVGITVSALSSDSDASFIVSQEDTLISSAATESDRDTYGASLGLEWVRYFRPEARWSFFAGLGPSVSFAHNTFTDKSADETVVRDDKTKLWGFGVNGLFGGEWFATRVIGIHAEYRIGAGYNETWENATSTGPGADGEVHREDKSWSLSPGFVRFGLSAYF